MTRSDGPLRAARAARKWSQGRAAAELAQLAEARGIQVAGPASLKTQLSRWENQHAVPEEHYRELLCALYESTEAELGLRTLPAEEPIEREGEWLRAALAESTVLDDVALDLLEAQLEATRRLDHRLGTSASSDTALAQLNLLTRLLEHALHAQPRRRLAGLVVDAAVLAAEHALDRLRYVQAWSHLGTARAAALEVGSAPLVSYAMIRQASMLFELEERQLGFDLVERAVGLLPTDLPGPLLAWFNASQGHALAALGRPGPAHSAYRLAERQLRADFAYPNGRPELPTIEFDLAALVRHRGHTRLLLHEDDAAITDLERALDADGAPTRDVAGAHIDLAYALGVSGQSAAATEHAEQARGIVTRIGSLRLARQLDERPASGPAQPVRTG